MITLILSFEDYLRIWAQTARLLVRMNMNHDRRNERIRLLRLEIARHSDTHGADHAARMRVLDELLITLHWNAGSELTHSDVKTGLRFFAELCEHLITDIAKEREQS